MNLNLREFRNPRRRRLFIPLNGFSFASFVVPIKFRQPVPASTMLFSNSSRAGMHRTRLLDGTAN
jgi:hypothetical protein